MSILLLGKGLGLIGIIVLALLAISLFDLKSQVSRYEHYWKRNNDQPSVPGEILYVAIGDSTAQGIGASHPDKSYPGIIHKTLEEQSGKPVRLVNLSKTGATIRDSINTQMTALNRLSIDQATVITVEIGANDMINFDASQFEIDMNEFMARLPHQAVMSDIPYFGSSRFKNKEKDVQLANKIMYRLAEKHGIELVPLHDRMQANNGLKTLAVDFFHPSDLAYRENWAPVFMDKINDQPHR